MTYTREQYEQFTYAVTRYLHDTTYRLRITSRFWPPRFGTGDIYWLGNDRREGMEKQKEANRKLKEARP